MLFTDEELMSHIFWPYRETLDPRVVWETIRRVRRFIDFDETIGMWCGRFMQPTLCGKPTAAFLAEEPFIVQTWAPGNAIRFFMKVFPHVAKPELILVPPAFQLIGSDGYTHIGKDFIPFGLHDAVIIDDLIDDFGEQSIRAPGCTIMGP